jgi:hypothetical protein
LGFSLLLIRIQDYRSRLVSDSLELYVNSNCLSLLLN